MLIIKSNNNKPIERMLKEYKRKINSTKQILQLRENGQYTKPSESNRKMKKNAIYKQKLNNENDTM